MLAIRFLLICIYSFTIFASDIKINKQLVLNKSLETKLQSFHSEIKKGIITNNFLITANRSIKIWDIKSLKLIKTFSEHTKETITSIKYIKPTNILVSVGHDGNIVTYDLNTLKVKKRVHGHKEIINVLKISRDNKLIFTGSYDNSKVKIWDTETLKLINIIKMEKPLYDLVLDRNGKYIICTGFNGGNNWQIDVYNIKNGIKIDELSTLVYPLDNKNIYTHNNYLFKSYFHKLRAEIKDNFPNILKKNILFISKDNNHLIYSDKKEIVYIKKNSSTKKILLKNISNDTKNFNLMIFDITNKYIFYALKGKYILKNLDNLSQQNLYTQSNKRYIQMQANNKYILTAYSKRLTEPPYRQFFIEIWNHSKGEFEITYNVNFIDLYADNIKLNFSNDNKSIIITKGTSKYRTTKYETFDIDTGLMIQKGRLDGKIINKFLLKDKLYNYKSLRRQYGHLNSALSGKMYSITKRRPIIQKTNYIIAPNLDNLLIIDQKNNHIDEIKGEGWEKGIRTYDITYDNKYIATSYNDTTIKIFNRKTKKLFSILSKHKEKVYSLRFTKDNKYLISIDALNVYIWDYKSSKVIKQFKNNATLDIKVTDNNFFTFNEDGRIDMYSLINFGLVASFIHIQDTSIVLTKEGYFSGRGDINKYIHYLKDGKEIIDFNMFYDHFFRPDLVKLKLAGKEKEYKKAIGEMTYQEALKNPPPKLSFKSIDNKNIKLSGFEYNDVNTSKGKVKLSFNVNEHDNGGVGLIRVYQEGKLIKTIGKGKINKQSANVDTVLEQEQLDLQAKENQKVYIASLAKSINSDINMSVEDTIAKVQPTKVTNHTGIYDVDVELKAGKNEISIEAFNKTNTVTSYRENISINADIPKHKPKIYAIVAGVNEFEVGTVNNLKYSQNDAKAIKKAVENSMYKVFDDVEVTYLIGKDVTKDNILKAAKEIAKKARLEDTILFYISTHGRAYKGKLYLVPYNNKSVTDWIDFGQTFQAIQSIKALNQIFVVDACESGKANDIVSSVYDSRASVLAKSSGVHVLLATTKGTSAFESSDPTIHHSVFTHRILQALKDKSTDTNKDSFVSIIELSKKLKEPSNNTNYQYPVIRNVGSNIQLEKIE